ncbi:MAG TPA: hypothetical protein VMG12_31935 [Polyangiaceae bacterium]|nr:hypothetical protein [Polyangiaceae bacterium]
MKWQLRSGVCGGVALLLGVTANGCTEEQTGFFILGNVVIDAPECVARAEGSSTLLDSGVLDVALRPDYIASLLVGSQLAPRGDKPNLRTETMITTITGAEIHLYTDTGEPDPNSPSFTVPAAGVIMPDASADPGFGIVTATLIPAATGVEIGRTLEDRATVRTRVAVVTVFGKTIGGLDVETAPHSYVIRVCKGCLVDFPADAVTDQGSCFGSTSDTQVPPCRVGQDDPVDCRICAGSNPFCAYPGGVMP